MLKNILHFVRCAICGAYRAEDSHCPYCDARVIAANGTRIIVNHEGTMMARVVSRAMTDQFIS